jgi:hypothetical protein
MSIQAISSTSTAVDLLNTANSLSSANSTTGSTQNSGDTTTVTTAPDGTVTTTVTGPKGNVISVTVTQSTAAQTQAGSAGVNADTGTNATVNPNAILDIQA